MPSYSKGSPSTTLATAKQVSRGVLSLVLSEALGTKVCAHSAPAQRSFRDLQRDLLLALLLHDHEQSSFPSVAAGPDSGVRTFSSCTPRPLGGRARGWQRKSRFYRAHGESWNAVVTVFVVALRNPFGWNIIQAQFTSKKFSKFSVTFNFWTYTY